MTESTTQTTDSTTENFVPQFSDLGLNKPILKALTKSGYTTPTPIQAKAIPHALNGRDLLLSAQTGSGKTAAFVLPVLDKMSRKPTIEKHVQALILTPTRELALQVQDSVRRYGDGMRNMFSVPLVGGAPYGGQLRALKKGVQVIIATPGRLIDHMREGRVDLSKLDMLILDEADRMLDMGFADDIKEILQNTPQTRQTVMSSATWDGAVGKIAESFTVNPEKVSIKVESAHIDESVYYCDDFNHKNNILLQVLNNPKIKQAVIFAATKMSTEKLAAQLVEAGFKARYLHGDLPQGKRNRIVRDMKSGKCDVLVATDVAARGIDISAISHVINYDLPRQVEDYVHRIGRCGRAGRTGVAVNLCSIDDNRQLEHINRYLKRQMSVSTIEGLEPRRNFGIQSQERHRGRSKSQNRTRQDGRQNFERTDHKFGSRNRHEHRHERSFEGKRERFEDRERSVNRRENDENHERRNSRFEARSDRRFDKNRQGYYQADGTARQDKKAYTRNFDRRDNDRNDTRFDKPTKKFGTQTDFDRPRRNKAFGDKVKPNTGFDKFGGKSRPKAVEEIFFAKRQDKKAKRRFGEF
ncbi:DEAD/DEAH box helicase [Moraxella catarrhalis]|uniref:DEAD/DEAH box helicase n=1 Tax=Moraxella catarrhalis TaxID=480 RepID=UPI00128CF399|nr:DEAD/DEAH box helicase [Moraxella catarrhalis]MPW84607.1 DEAD/DEAH box helicase [Moraxella catarrhalis]MPW92751.1 DEAD/DEAH box helicase [Moraxella catarrhalis]